MKKIYTTKVISTPRKKLILLNFTIFTFIYRFLQYILNLNIPENAPIGGMEGLLEGITPMYHSGLGRDYCHLLTKNGRFFRKKTFINLFRIDKRS